ncbi:hypothetical protein OK016_24575 [Vibrio chagasii]|nr:hypothetical protein [Vibrio chagasii]
MTTVNAYLKITWKVAFASDYVVDDAEMSSPLAKFHWRTQAFSGSNQQVKQMTSTAGNALAMSGL